MNSLRQPTIDELNACLTHPATIINTAKGPMEYAERGEGQPLLCVHGGPGGYDQGLVLGELFRSNGFKIIALSRPGYLETPLATGATPKEQAEALAALLEALDIPRAAVIGVSAGGPPSYMLAALYPKKVSALIEIDSVSLTYAPEISPLEEKMYLSRVGTWLTQFFLNHFPESAVKSFLKSESSLERQEIIDRARHIIGDESKLAYLKLLIATMAERFPERQTGVHNDLAQCAAITQLPLASITCPTLIVHGTADKDVIPAHAEYAKATIPDSELYWIASGSHIAFWAADEADAAQEHVVTWLRKKMRN